MKTCPHCNCTDIDEDPARGDATCMGCGTVLEESIVVTENQFQERAGGSGHTLVGQFVSAEKAASNNFNGMGTQESREVTYAKGRKVIEEISSQLRINQHCIETAFNFYKMCVSRNLTRGRTRTAVVAVNLYITCRLENTAHLLLDFSDVTQINVFDLGRNLNFISRSLKINLPATDPCIYILRFACMLDFGDKQKEVVNLATRLVQRMKRDWMSTGRRPTGICGAALLMASRSLNFNRSIGDIVRVVHISEGVIRKRLDEFSQTPSGSLTIDEFSNIDLEHSEDPPAYRDARRRAREEQLRKEAEQAELMEKDLGDMEAQVEIALDKKRKEKFSRSPYAKLVAGSIDGVEKAANDLVQKEILSIVYDAATDDPSSSSISSDTFQKFGPSLESLGIKRAAPEQVNDGRFAVPEVPATPSSAAPETATKNGGGMDDEDLEGDISDSEIDSYILTEKEVEIKTDYWMKANGDVLKAMEERRKEREENGEVKRKRRPTKSRNAIVANSALDAMEKVIQEKKLSNKINYDMLKDLESFSKKTPTTTTAMKTENSMSPMKNAKNEETLANLDPFRPLSKSERITSRKNLKMSKDASTLDALRDVFEIRKEDSSAQETAVDSKATTVSKTPLKIGNNASASSRYSKIRPNLMKGVKMEKKDAQQTPVVENVEKEAETIVVTEKEPEVAIAESESAENPVKSTDLEKVAENAENPTEISGKEEASTSAAKSGEEERGEVKKSVVTRSRYGKAKPNLKKSVKTEQANEPDAKRAKV